jgi:taurine dioxygenase
MIRNPRFQMRVRWEPGTVVLWDNWATQHFTSGDHYPTYDREVHRVTVKTDGRIGDRLTLG